VFAFVFIVYKIKSGLAENLNYIKSTKVEYQYLVISLFLMLLNWGVESYKWKYIIRKYVQINFFKAFKFVLTGVTISLITPNRVGEIPARVMLLNGDEKSKDLVWLTTLGAFSQLLITVILGVIGLFFSSHYFENYYFNFLFLVLFGCVLLLSMLFVSFQKMPSIFQKIPILNKLSSKDFKELSFVELANVLILSALRYAVFCLQYWLVLKAFTIHLDEIQEIMLIPVCFLIASIIPTILLSEIGVRTSVAVFVFGMVSDNVIAIILASLLLWIINIALPAFFGLFNLNQLTILKE
jgi:Lysylphosphatidylglycerol synthase TM region